MIFKNEFILEKNQLHCTKWPRRTVHTAIGKNKGGFAMATSRIFCQKSTFFLIYEPKDPAYSWYYFHTKLLVVVGHLRRQTPQKTIKNARNNICFVTLSLSSALWLIHRLKALDLKFQKFGRLIEAMTLRRSRAKWTKIWKWL